MEQNKKILIIKIGAMGDILRITPVVHSLSDFGFQIDILTSRIGKEIFKNNPFVNNIYILYHKRNFLELFFLLSKLKRVKFNYLINFESFNMIRKFANRLNADKIINLNDFFEYINVIELFYLAVNKIMPNSVYNKYSIEIYPSQKDKEKIDNFLIPFNTKKKIVFHIGSSKTNRLLNKNFNDIRLWDINNYLKTIQKLLEQNYYIFLIGSKLEKVINRKIKEKINHKNLIIIHNFSLQELFYFISKCDWFISSDTGPAHLAAGTKINQICLCGPTDAEISAPMKRKNLFILQKNNENCPPCYNDITRK
ncbi:MAG TPA: glycosyltransferase family 9 protein, partial [bacterium]|nr:glycosyltransferase family 9 protein [bacterium]